MTDKSKNYKGPTLDLTKLKNLPEIKEFLKNLQCGDIQLSRPIPYGITLYGQTKVGKTSACHCLSLSPLKGSKIGGQVKFITTTNNYKTAQIGNQGNSKTQIPNFFQLRMSENGKPIVLIDTPGYGDTYGVYRILSNGFYHYRLYSKVQNMKFLITFDTINLKNTAQSIIKTIQHFTNSFKYYKNKEQRDEIWSAAAFLITKVQNGQNQIKDIKDKFTNLADTLKTQLNEEDDKLFRQFLRYIVKENKIFIIKHAIQNQSPDFTGLLQKINLNIKCWWKRQVINGIVNMQPINFAIGKKLNTCLSGDYSQKSKAQFADLMIYMNYNSNYYLNKAKGSIKNFLKQIGQDAVKAPNSHKFLNLMKEFVDENYNFNKEHKQRRQIQEKRLFEYVAHNPQNSSPTQANKLHSDKQKQAYLIKKFKVLQFVQKIKKQINQNEDNQKISLLEFASQRIYELIKLLNTVRFMVSDSKDIIYKYGYLMHRIFEESKIFILLIQGEENKLYKESLFNTDVSKDNNFKPFQITRNLKDLMGAGNEQGFSLEKIKEKYILDFDFSNKDIVLSQSLIDFFTSLKVTDNKIAQNIIQLVSRYCNQIIIKKQKNNYSIKNTEAKRLIRRLYVCRQQCDCLIIESKNQGNKKQTQSLIMVLRSLTIQIGYLLQQIGCISTAIQVYETIYFVQKVLNLYQEIIKNQPQNIEKRIDYAIYASQHYRQNLAIQILQTSFQVATNYQDLEEVKKKLINIKLKSKSQELGLSYGKQLNNDNFYKPFNYALQSSIGNIIEEDVIQSQVNSEETPK